MLVELFYAGKDYYHIFVFFLIWFFIIIFILGVEKSITGKQFEGIKDLHNVGDKESHCDVQHQKGEVLIVDFWAPWCGPCIGAMDKN